jgi:hypothetical protein
MEAEREDPMKLIAAAVLLGLGAQEQMDNPQYAHWKAFKPGSWVKHKMVMDAGGRQVTTETTTTLVEVTPEKVVVEAKTSMDMGGQKMDLPSQKKDVLARIEKKEGQAPPSEKDEDVAVDGKTYKCRAYAWEQTEKGQTMKGKGWMCADVPGGMVKSEIHSPQLPKPMLMTLVGFEKK